MTCIRFLQVSTVLLAVATLPLCAQSGSQPSEKSSAAITIDAHAAATPFPHFWEQMFGSGRANLSLAPELPRRSAAC